MIDSLVFYPVAIIAILIVGISKSGSSLRRRPRLFCCRCSLSWTGSLSGIIAKHGTSATLSYCCPRPCWASCWAVCFLKTCQRRTFAFLSEPLPCCLWQIILSNGSQSNRIRRMCREDCSGVLLRDLPVLGCMPGQGAALYAARPVQYRKPPDIPHARPDGTARCLAWRQAALSCQRKDILYAVLYFSVYNGD